MLYSCTHVAPLGVKGLSDPYYQSTCMSVCLSVLMLSANLMQTILETKRFRASCPIGAYSKAPINKVSTVYCALMDDVVT